MPRTPSISPCTGSSDGDGPAKKKKPAKPGATKGDRKRGTSAPPEAGGEKKKKSAKQKDERTASKVEGKVAAKSSARSKAAAKIAAIQDSSDDDDDTEIGGGVVVKATEVTPNKTDVVIEDDALAVTENAAVPATEDGEGGDGEEKQEEAAHVLRMRAALLALRERRAELEEVRNELHAEQAAKSALQTKFDALYTELETARDSAADVEPLRLQVKALQSEVDDAKKQTNELRAAASEDARKTAVDRTALEEAVSRADSLKLQLGQQLETARKSLEESSREAVDLKAQVIAARTELLEGRKQTEALRADVEEARALGAMHVPDLRAALEARLLEAWKGAWKEVSSVQELPHRTAMAGTSNMRRLNPSTRGNARKINFAPVERLAKEIPVRSYRDQKSALWFDMPESNVVCEVCQRRVTQKQGRLRGAIGRSQFMLDEFLCADCFSTPAGRATSKAGGSAAAMPVSSPLADSDESCRDQDEDDASSSSAIEEHAVAASPPPLERRPSALAARQDRQAARPVRRSRSDDSSSNDRGRRRLNGKPPTRDRKEKELKKRKKEKRR